MNNNFRKITSIIATFALSGLGFSASAKTPIKNTPTVPVTNDKTLYFVENKGQWEPQARFRAELPNYGTAFFTNDGIVYSYASKEDWGKINHVHCETDATNAELEALTIRNHAFKVQFKNSNQQAVKAVGGRKSPTYHNYFIGSDKSKWASRVGLFAEARFENIYDGVDVVYYGTNKSNLKYDFIVKSGSSPSQIQLTFDGVTPRINEAGDLVIKTSVNEIHEKAPYSFQLINGDTFNVDSRYVLNKGVLSFEFPNGYNSNYDLIIDPELVYATYSGGSPAPPFSSGMYSGTTTYDPAGNTYVGAKCYHTGWPTSMGAFMTNFVGGGTDVGISKYNALGTGILYSTYYGGSGADVAVTLRVNSVGELVVGGMTTSTSIPMVANPFKGALSGGKDIFLARLSADGTQMLGATYVGTTNDEMGSMGWGNNGMSYFSEGNNISCGLDINFDANDNIWVVTATNSPTWPTTSNAMQLTFGGGVDGVLMKFNPEFSTLLYSSYIGGSGNDVLYGIELLANGNPVICGATSSLDFPATPGSYMPSNPGGNSTGFLAVVNEVNGSLLSSTYVGTTAVEQISHVQVDADQNIVALVRTTSNDYPVSQGAYTNVLTGANKLAIHKFNATLTTSIRSSLMIGSGTFFPSAFVVDLCGNAYVATMAPGANMPPTADAFQPFQDDFYLYALDRTFNELIFGSYFGDNALGTGSSSNDHCHMGVNRLDPQGIVYHSICNNSGTWLPAVYGGNVPANLIGREKPQNYGQDILTFKFNFDKTGVSATFDPDRQLNPIDSGCIPYTVVFQNTSQQARSFFWDFGDGNTSTQMSPTHTYTTAGVFDVMMVAINDSTCITHDTAWLSVTAYDIATPQLIVSDTNLCTLEDNINISVQVVNPSVGVPGNVFNWGPAAGIIGTNNTATISVNPNINRSYTVRVIDSVAGVCSRAATATVNINMTPRNLDILTSDTSVCDGSLIEMRAIGSPGYTYKWSPALGVSDTNQLQPSILATQNNIYTLTASYPFCIDTSVMFYLNVEEYPRLQLVAPTEACEKSEVEMTTNVTPYRNDYTYVWTPVTGLSYPNGPNTTFIADTTRHYQVHVSTPSGCADSIAQTIVVHKKGNGDAISGADYCAPGSAQLWAANGNSYLWEPSIGLNDPTLSNPVTSVTTDTEYKVYVTDANGCIDTLSVLVEVHPRAVLNLPDTVTVYAGEGYQVAANTNALHFNWFPPSGVSNPNVSDPYLAPTVRTKYIINAETEFGCKVTDTLDVLVGNPMIDMPNAYAPNNEGAKLFKPVVKGSFALKSFVVYNRWGTKVYESTNINEGWDGTHKGVAQPFGVYVYTIEAVSESGETYSQTGNVTLIR